MRVPGVGRVPWWAASAGLLLAAVVVMWLFYPKDTTPKGAYLRVMTAVNSGEPKGLFPYLETAAQHACFTIHEYDAKSLHQLEAAYPEAEKAVLVARLAPLVKAEAGPGIFEYYARRQGWIDQLRRDLSGVQSVHVEGERATVETVRGTRYPFRRRENGIWGLTLFTSTLVAEADRAARDFAMIEQAAKEFERGQRSAQGAQQP